MKFKFKISKQLLMRIMLFAMLTGTAMAFDFYLEKHPEALPPDKLNEGENKKTADEHGTVYLISQVNSLNAKTTFQKTPSRKLFDSTHNKFLQQCHQLQNLQALKAKIVIPQKQRFISLYLLCYMHCYFQHPDDEPHLS